MKLKISLFLLSLLLLQMSLYAQDYALYYTISDSLRIGFTGAPYASYTSETGVRFGVSLLMFEKNMHQNIISGQNFRLRIDGEFADEGQKEFGFSGSIPLRAIGQRLDINTQYKRANTDFWGIGNNTTDEVKCSFTREQYIFYGNWIKLLSKSIGVGIAYDISGYENSDFSNDDIPIITSINGGKGFYRAVGLGATFIYSTKRPNNFPTSGWYYKNQVLFYDKAYKSDYCFITWSQEIHYFYAIQKHIIANQIKTYNTYGDRPYHYYAEQGGSSLGRGYKTARFLEYHFVGGQTEYRSPIFWWRVSSVCFGAVGLSYRSTKDIIGEAVHFSGGFGLRFALDKKERVNIRADIGFSKEGQEIYLKFGEGF